jgi:hypothetical protein
MQLFVFLAPPFTYLYYLYMLLFSMSLFAFVPMLNMLFCPSVFTICKSPIILKMQSLFIHKVIVWCMYVGT